MNFFSNIDQNCKVIQSIIFSALYDFPAGFKSPEGLAIDWLSRNMYVTDSELDIIAVMTTNGTYRKTIINEDLVNPRAIVVDPSRGYVAIMIVCLLQNIFLGHCQQNNMYSQQSI